MRPATSRLCARGPTTPSEATPGGHTPADPGGTLAAGTLRAAALPPHGAPGAATAPPVDAVRAEEAARLRGRAARGDWPAVLEALDAAGARRRLDFLLSAPVDGGTLAAGLVEALTASAASPRAAPRLSDGQLAALGLATLRAREAAPVRLWLQLAGAGLPTLVAERGGLARQAAAHAPLLRALLAPLDPSQRAALFLAEAAPIVGALIGQLAATVGAAELLDELVETALAHAGPGPAGARALIDRAPALLVGGRGHPGVAAIAARLRAQAGLVPRPAANGRPAG